MIEKFRRRLMEIRDNNLEPAYWIIHPDTAGMVLQELNIEWKGDPVLLRDTIWSVPVLYSADIAPGEIKAGFRSSNEAYELVA